MTIHVLGNSNIDPVEARARIKSRACALLRTLGSDGRNVLSKGDIKCLVNWAVSTGPADARHISWFAALEADISKRHGLILQSAIGDGVHRVGRDRRVPATAKPAASVIDDRSWRIPAARPAGENIVDFAATRKRLASTGSDGPRAA